MLSCSASYLTARGWCRPDAGPSLMKTICWRRWQAVNCAPQ